MRTTIQLDDLTPTDLQALLVSEGKQLTCHQILARKKFVDRIGNIENVKQFVRLLQKLN